jgi:hypothetical protein
VSGRLSSYRFRRRLLWLGLAAVALGSAALVSILFWNTGPLKDEHFSGGSAQVYVEPTVTKLTPEEQQAIVAIAKRFVSMAVTRDDPESAYDLAGPNMRTGTTRASWKTGEIPVVPFPVDTARWRVDYSYEDEVGLEVYAWPEPDAGLQPTLFMMSLVAVGKGDARHWLVDSWIPRGGRPDVLRQRVNHQTPLQAAIAEQNQKRYGGSMSAAWLLAFPAALLAILIAVPAWVMLRNRRFARRALRS